MVGLLTLDESVITKLGEKTTTAYLYGLKDNGEPDPAVNFAFQYFPDTISDTKQVNWATREIPGGSLPVYQWISSGERAISFTAWFTTDVNIASTEAKDVFNRLKNAGATRRNIDVRSALVSLRRFMLPRYGAESTAGVQIAMAPQKLILGLPGTAIGVTGGVIQDQGASAADLMSCIMTQCDVTYEAFFPNGLPRIASVSLSFLQIAQAAKGGSVIFPERGPEGNAMDKLAKGGSGTPFYGYPLEVQIGERKDPS